MASSSQVDMWQRIPVKLPKVIAHRGANDTEPEHSLAAYIRRSNRALMALSAMFD